MYSSIAEVYLKIDQIEFMEELAIQQVPSRYVVVRRQLLSHQSGIDLVHQHENPLGDLSHCLSRMVQTGRT